MRLVHSRKSSMSQQEIVHAYRHLFRNGLRAVQFSKPARFTLRDKLRALFRRGSVADFESSRIQNTLEFLRHASTHNGLEHKIVKNLMHVWWVQERGGKTRTIAKNMYVECSTAQQVLICSRNHDETLIRTTIFDSFNHSISMLNESMDMCLPADVVRSPYMY